MYGLLSRADCVFSGGAAWYPTVYVVLTEACPDFDGDGMVGAFDLAIVLGGWGACEDSCCPTDFDENGQTAAFDLAILLGAWGPCE